MDVTFQRCLRIVAVLVASFSLNTQAAGLRASPIRLEFSSPKQILPITLGNPDSTANVFVQLSLFRWTQQDGEDVLTPSRDLIATPPGLEIAAGGQREVRVGARRYATEACETSYRLFVTEIPPLEQESPPIRFRTQMRLPVFTRTASDCRASLSWSRQNGRLEVENRGNGHAQLQFIEVSDGTEASRLNLRHVGYVLPLARIPYELPNVASNKPLTVRYGIENREYSQTLPAID